MPDVECHHCGNNIEGIPFVPSQHDIFWCAHCLTNGGRELLHTHGVDLTGNDDYYKSKGWTYWKGDGVISEKVKSVPKIKRICPFHYYGVGACVCGRGQSGNSTNKNSYGY